MHDRTATSAKLVNILDSDFPDRVLTKMANNGAFRLILMPASLRQSSSGYMKLSFAESAGQEIELILDYQIQPSLETTQAGILFESLIDKTFEPQTKINLDFYLF